MKALEVKGLCKQYENFALDNVSFSLEQGTITGLVGRNGAGKTTILRSILGAAHLDAGTISLLGKPVDEQTKQEIGVVYDTCCFGEMLKIGQIDRVLGDIYRNWSRDVFLGMCEHYELPENKTIKTFSRAFGGAALGTIVALIQFKNGQIMPGSLFIIIILSSEFFIPLRLLGSYFHIAMNGMAASDRIFKILDAKEREKNINNDIVWNNENMSVSLKNVSFSYDGEREVISNINLNIEDKGLTAIVGESGSGKSTIASLILNEYRVTQGNILLNNVDLEEISMDKIYDNIAIVSTNSYIFNGTILDNLMVANKSASEKEIVKALKTARLYDFVNSLKDGLLTYVGQSGSNLSGGQKQRLALARAILSNREMIIFDEATSNIDVESEENIWKAIYDLSKKKTILVISHRLANVKDAKKIYVLNKGKLVEEGRHDSLMQNKSYYFDMVNKQEELESIREVC